MEERKSNVITYVGGAIIILLLIGLLFAVNSNSKNKKSLKAEILTSEKLLSEKLMVENELTKLKADFAALEEKSNTNAALLEQANKKIAESQRRINSLNSENRSLRGLKKELDDLQTVKANLEKEALQLKSEYDQLMAKNADLQNSLSAMEKEKQEIASVLENTLKYTSDNFLVTATRGKKKEKVVVCAMRTKKLNMTFDVPQSLTEEISFKIVTPTGTTINPDDKALSWTFRPDSRNFTASLSAVTGEFEQSRQVVLTYTAKEKLVAGEYKIQILCNGNNIGNCRIKLK